MQYQELVPHLFRSEFSKITAVLCKRFGIQHISVAEDIAGDTFLAAWETWSYKGLPENPTAWLYTVAKHKATNHVLRNQLFAEKIAGQLVSSGEEAIEQEIDLSEKNILDSQLQMLFAICHPAIAVEAQIGLALRILCGFGIDEIADAFLSNKETINKRLFRAKEKLRTENVRIAFPPESDIQERLGTVLTTLYLLFNEGYYSESHKNIVRKDLCLEAMRLTYLLIDNALTNRPAVNALLALMCFHASRLDARTNENGDIILFHDQDESLWNTDLIAKGIYYFNRAASEQTLSKYHLEAGIAYWNTQKADTPEKWQHVLLLYDQLLAMTASPVAALNRVFALSKVHGNRVAIEAALQLQLTDNQFYFTLLGELYRQVDPDKAVTYFHQAFGMAKTDAERRVIQQKIDGISN